MMIAKGSAQRSGTRTLVLFAVLSAALTFLSASAASAQSQSAGASKPFVCNGRYKGGIKPTASELAEILIRHKHELALTRDPGEAPKDSPEIANLCGADLRELNLSKVNLSYAHLEGADLSGANLAGADLARADLSATEVRGANLSDTKLTSANLTRADLIDTAFTRTDLTGAHLISANLDSADLSSANLDLADFSGSNLRHALIPTLSDTNFTGADLSSANLSGALLLLANFSGADLSWANLTDAILAGANLSDAKLPSADLSEAEFFQTKMKGSRLYGANVNGAYFDADFGSFPEAGAMAYAINLSKLNFSRSDAALERLRSEFKIVGLHDQARQLTYAIRHSELLSRTNDGMFIHPNWERFINHYLFEVTCDYGMSPLKILPTLIYLISAFMVVYLISILVSSHLQNPRSGIWAVWIEDRINKNEGSARPLLLTEGFPPSRFSETFIGGWFRKLKLSAVMLALYFSLLSTLRIGWREFNVGSWLVRVQKREYVLQATGWVRVMSGIQSLISVYLIALFLLTYFSTPFEY